MLPDSWKVQSSIPLEGLFCLFQGTFFLSITRMSSWSKGTASAGGFLISVTRTSKVYSYPSSYAKFLMVETLNTS